MSSKIKMVWIPRVMWSLFVLVLVVSTYLFIVESVREANETRNLSPIGRFVTLSDGRKIHLNCTGGGEQTVIFESGSGGLSTKWADVQPAISKITRACSYDRAGLGWSDEGPGQRTVGTEADDLHEMLTAAGEKPPFILVGHSLGGEISRVFAARYRDEVHGLVMVDPGHESDMLIKNDSSLNYKLNNAQQVAEMDGVSNIPIYLSMVEALLGLVRHDQTSAERPDNGVTKAERTQNREGYLWSGKRLRTVLREGAVAMRTNNYIEHNEAANLANLPTIFIIQPSRKNQSKAFCSLSTNCSVVFSSKDDHEIPEYQPEIIIYSIQKVLNGNVK